ncbi:hypothetical protein Ddye_030378 [Dipteronia dyeriana]|uniref:Reverse transcriptase zinc-binding domain-containing protein n=1 Tax=Dipteronia dyeriana TaxID=168575 RepID=A0AAD9TGZ3_9ROSI|nr:hypothetical protein Ddye_030378 [Dipteronia dyeriana]
MTADASCRRCEAGIENVDHLLRGCRVSIAVWEAVSKGITSSISFKGGLDVWLADNLRIGTLGPGNLPNYLFTPSIISRFGREWLDANDTGPGWVVCCILVVWVPPSEGLVKLNVGGSCDGDLGTITAGGVVRNHLKEWLRGFILNKGIRSVLEAELWSMFQSLTMLNYCGN